jgi:hypothetical protein
MKRKYNAKPIITIARFNTYAYTNANTANFKTNTNRSSIRNRRIIGGSISFEKEEMKPELGDKF